MTEKTELLGKIHGVRRFTVNVNIDLDKRFWALLPAVNLNFHGGFAFEFEWLCIGIYIEKSNGVN